ncbi:MAG: hypothetical protein IJ019_05755 [Alphaproteobacteria bacterium]|nr:hypothetical protein [Alphaproteobacteria bacterium]
MNKDQEDLSIDEILASIRNVLWEKQVEKNASRSCIRDYAKEREGDVFVLTPQMLAKNWDIPYEYANWDFDDVAARILHKYSEFFAMQETNDKKESFRVMVKKGY